MVLNEEQWIKELREKRIAYGISQGRLAVASGITREYLNKIEALKKLPERKRNTLLMYYFLEMTESEIANLQKITQSGVFRNRHHALEIMKKILKEEH